MARFRNDTGSVLHSHEFGMDFPPGEFEVDGYDPEVHGVIPGCTWLDAPQDEPGAPGDRTASKTATTDAESGKEPAA